MTIISQLTLLGNKIRALREKTGHSQDDFAALVGLNRVYYGDIERGKRNVSAINLIKIAITLDVEVGDLFPPISELKITNETSD